MQPHTEAGSSVSVRWAALSAALLVQTTISVVTQGVPALAPFFQSDFGLSHSALGLFVSTINIGTVLALPLAGWAVDRLGERTVLALGGLATGAAVMSVALAPTFLLAFVLLCLIGIGSSTPTPAGTKAIMHWFPLRQRAFAMSIRQTGVPLGGAIAALSLPTVATVWGWRPALAVAGAVTVTAALLSLWLYRSGMEPLSAPSRSPLQRSGRTVLREVVTRNILLASTSGLFLGFGQVCAIAYLVLYLRDTWHVPVLAGMPLLLAMQLAGGVGRIAWGVVSDRLCGGKRKGVLIGMVIVGALAMLGLAWLPINSPWLLLAAVVCLYGVTGMGWNGVFVTLISEQSHPDRHGTTLGFAMLFAYTGQILGPPLFGLLLDHFHSYRMGWGIIAALLTVACLLLLPIDEPTKEVATHG